MNSLPDLVVTASKEISGKCRVDADLQSVAAAIDSENSLRAAAKRADLLLREREEALRAAMAEVETLRSRVAQAAEVLPFTAEGWPGERHSLERLFAEEPETGLATWLDDWYRAAARGQVSALRRLTHEIELPAAMALVRQRFAAAADTLGDERLWQIVDPVLAAGARGLELEGRSLLPDEVRAELQLERARLALDDDRPDVAKGILDEEGVELDPVRTAALRARIHALRGEPEEATRCLGEARGDDPANFDVAIAAIESDLIEGRTEAALDAARLAVDAPPTLEGVEGELAVHLGTAPAEMHVAAAERALAEEDLDRCERRLAEAVGPMADNVEATAWELRAGVAEHRGSPVGEQARARMEAGLHWMWAEKPQRALAALERAVELTPTDPEALLSLADCLVVLADTEPFESAKPLAERALDLIRRGGGEELSTERSWGHLVTARAHEFLAEAIEPERRDHLWSAFAASCRATARAPYEAARWQQLGRAAEDLDIPKASIVFATRALRIEPNSDHAADLTRVLANAGRLREALKTLGQDSDPWSQAVRAYVRLRTRRWSQAVRLLRTTKLEKSWYWASHALTVGLLLTDRYDEAATEAEASLEDLAESLDRFQARLEAADLLLVLGRLDEAEKLVQPLEEIEERNPDVALILGVARLLRGEEEAGLEKLVEAMTEAPSVAGLEEWRTVVKPVLRALAANHGASLPPLDAVDEAARARRRELNRLDTPVEELRHAVATTQRGDSATETMGQALIELAEDELEAAATTLEAALAEEKADPDLEALLAQVRAWQAAEVDTVVAAEDEEADAGGEEAEPPQLLQMGIPASWVESDPDPIATHPIFRRYMPELRLRLGWKVPPVHIYADEELEPGGYRILLGEEVVAEGTVDPGSDYLLAASLGLLSKGVRAAAEPDAEDWLRVPHQTIAEAGGLAELLSVSPHERAVRRLGEVVEAHEDLLRERLSV